MEWLTIPVGLVLLFGLRYVLTAPFRRAVESMRGDDRVTGKPFSEAEYAENHAGSRDWGLQQAMRRAAVLAKKGRTAEAVAILAKVRGAVTDPGAREVLDQEIRRLGGAPPQPPAAVRKKDPVPDDPYAERLE